MQAMKKLDQEAFVTCPHCRRSFKIIIGNTEARWQHFIFKCPECNEVNCVPKNEITNN